MTQTYTFSPVTATDRAGLVWVAAILSLMFSILTLATRFLIKFHTLGLDDWCIAGSTILAIGQYVAIYVGLSDGVGSSSELLDKQRAGMLGESVMTSEILFVLSLGLCKISVVFFTKRLFTKDHHKAWWVCNAALILSIAWTVMSALAVSVDCGPAHILYGSHRCVGKLARWTAVITTDALLEVLYVVLAVVLVYPLQMKTSVKATVVFAFAFRLISALFAAMHGVWIAKYVHASDPGLAIANVLVWQQVELGYALISSTVPTLKSFVRGYNKAMGWDPTYDSKRGLGGGYNLGTYGQNSGQRSAQVSAVGARSKSAGKFRHEDDDTIDLRSKTDGEYHAGAYHESNHGKGIRRTTSTGSGESEDPIIRRDIMVTVEHTRTSMNL